MQTAMFAMTAVGTGAQLIAAGRQAGEARRQTELAKVQAREAERLAREEEERQWKELERARVENAEERAMAAADAEALRRNTRSSVEMMKLEAKRDAYVRVREIGLVTGESIAMFAAAGVEASSPSAVAHRQGLWADYEFDDRTANLAAALQQRQVLEAGLTEADRLELWSQREPLWRAPNVQADYSYAHAAQANAAAAGAGMWSSIAGAAGTAISGVSQTPWARNRIAQLLDR